MAQVVDDFSDGDFSVHPTWTGTDSCFAVNANKQLQSTASAAGEAWLATAVPTVAEEWRFWLRENFSPSQNNYADVWLCADTVVLSDATRGYFLRFGSSGNQDAIELYRMEFEGPHLIAKGNDAAIASPFKVAVKVNRDPEGRWTIATDFDDTGNYVVEAEGLDDTYPIEGYFGIHLRFTASNARKFYFDDLYIGPEIVDTVAPEWLALETMDTRHLLLSFNEPLSDMTLDPWHYTVLPDVQPDSVCFDTHPSRLLLCYNSPLPENTNLTLRVAGVTDLSGNIMPSTERVFSIYQPAEHDVVINEIMADPSPVVGLPEWEYVELFNTSPYVIDLKDWTFFIGNTGKTFPTVQIEPRGYLILCKDDAELALGTFGSACGFSSFAIANAGATLRLVATDGTVMSEVTFNDNWYHDADKKVGGWSLEQIDPFNPCAGTLNWSASTDVSGGTPGRVNAINAPNETVPSVERVSLLGDDTVLLRFDQQMDRESLQDSSQYVVEELNLSPVEVICNPVESTSLALVFDGHFEEGAIYTLVLNGMTSCSGQPIAPDTKVRFGIPNEVGEGEILINEIMFDPISPAVDYVELYNRSDKTFDLSTLKLGVVKERFPSPADTVLKEITADSRLLLPGCYVLLSTDGYAVSRHYGCAMDNFFDMAAFPSYANAGGIALLMSRQGVTVDQMVFSEQMHDPSLKETKGVSLERVSWTAPSDQADNWHSAAEAVGFGTPGYRNSMMVDDAGEAVESLIRVAPEVFSPDGDGFDDHCQIHYQLDERGYTMNAYVFNAEGVLVRHLVKGALVTNEGCFVWNGCDSRGLQVPTGIYVVFTEVFDMEGKVRTFKNAVAVASR